MTPQSEFAEALRAVLAELETMLLEKNALYHNSALKPLRVFSTASWDQAIRVRLDDKLSRMKAAEAGQDTEDTELDTLGYLVLLRVGRRLKL